MNKRRGTYARKKFESEKKKSEAEKKQPVPDEKQPDRKSMESVD